MSNSLRLFLGLAALILLIPVGLGAAYMWHAGLDLQNPASARQWIKVCARSHIDLYCEAAGRVLREVDGPIIFLHPNMGDDQITAEMTAWKGRLPTPKELDAVARANLFPGSKLTGVVRSLDEQEHQVVCGGLPNERLACRVGHLRFIQRNQPRSSEDGAVYSVFGPQRQQNFFRPQPTATAP